MTASGKTRAIVIAGNPFFGRIIKDGIYQINSVPLSETHFSNDPDFPLKSSSVEQILKNKNVDVVSKSVEEDLPEQGVIIGDVTNYVDMVKWISKGDQKTILAGGAGFFDILLNNKYVKNPYPFEGEVRTGKHTLIVLGSTYPKTSELFERFSKASVIVKNMPEEIYCGKDYDKVHFHNWINEVTECLTRNEKVIVSVNYNYSKEEKLALRIRKTVSELVKNIVEKIELNDLFIEGGATTSEILKALQISKLYPCKELDFGIIQMKVDEYNEMLITTKPGSYFWPRSIVFENGN
jgi:uncharacterized protein YgbK (DUF1537 family)